MATNPKDLLFDKIKGNQNRKPGGHASTPQGGAGGNGNDGGSAPPFSSEERSIGKHFAEQMGKEKYEPVIILGPPSAGKSSVLASVLQPRRSLDVIFRPDCPLFPSNPIGMEMARHGVRFMENDVPDFAVRPVEATRFPLPIFLPILLVPRNCKLPTAKFAFLESQGELYNPEVTLDEVTGRFICNSKPLPVIVAEVLRYYTGPVSLIHVAACEEATNSTVSADRALLYCLQNYQRARSPAHAAQDRHLFLLTKWDRKARQVGIDSILHPDDIDIQETLEKEFNLSWTKYQGMRTHAVSGAPLYSQYISDTKHDGRYPRTLLNWLYTNSTGRALFKDVAPRSPPRWWEAMFNFLGL